MNKLLIALVAALIMPLTLVSVVNANVNRGDENVVGENCNKAKSNYYACIGCPDYSLCLFENERFNQKDKGGKEGAVLRFTRDQLLGSVNIQTVNNKKVRCKDLKWSSVVTWSGNQNFFSKVSSLINRTHRDIGINNSFNCSGNRSVSISHDSAIGRLGNFSFDNRTFSVYAPLK